MILISGKAHSLEKRREGGKGTICGFGVGRGGGGDGCGRGGVGGGVGQIADRGFEQDSSTIFVFCSFPHIAQHSSDGQRQRGADAGCR